jgi:dipeptidyl aminopeptidase/acylaminoacyl peptidase
MSAIIREDPEPIGKARPEVPPPLRWIVERCLAKDPEERYVSTRDLARDLASVRDHVSEITGAAEPPIDLGPRPLKRARRSTVLGATLLLLLLGAVAGWLVAARRVPKTSAPTFRRLTFRSGILGNARFTPDGQTVVYGVRWAGEPRRLYAVRPESPESRSFDLDADILAVSTSGEMAVLTNENRMFGTLARVPFAGGVPRPAIEGVPYAGADWSPDGRELAIVRNVAQGYRVEFPIGKVLHEGLYISGLRFSPGGDSIAFFQRGETGSVMVIPRSGGNVKTVVSGFSLPGGSPCWTPDGKEIWFTGARESGSPSGVHAVDLEGNVRLVAQMPGELELDDISRDGRVLLAHHTLIHSLRVQGLGDSVERDLTWLDRPEPFDVSADGKTILFSEVGEGGGTTGGVYVRKTDGSPAVRLGDGRGLALSPDGSTVLVEFPNANDRLALVPTGPGEPKTLPLAGFEAVSAAVWLADGKAFLLSARERAKNWRIYRVELPDGKPRPISAEGVAVAIAHFMTGPLSPDGRTLLSAQSPAKFARYALSAGQFRPIVGLERGEYPIRWASDGRAIYTRREVPPGLTQISRLDPDTGRRVPLREIRLGSGEDVLRVVMSPDGRAYAYAVGRAHSQLYVVEGLR